MADNDRTLSSAEFSKITGISVSAINQMLRQGKLRGEKRSGNRQEDLERRIQRRNLENNDHEAHAVTDRSNVALADTLGDRDRLEADRVARPQERHGDGRRINIAGQITAPCGELGARIRSCRQCHDRTHIIAAGRLGRPWRSVGVRMR